MPFRVPSRHLSAWQTLAGLESPQLKILVRSLEEARPALLPDDLANELRKRRGIQKIAGLGRVIDLLASLSLALYQRPQPLSEALRELRANSKASLKGKEPAVGWDLFREALEKMLGSPSLVITAKALTVQVAHQRIFTRSRVLTDLRPIFTEDVSKPPTAGVIAYSLEIEIWDGTVSRDGGLGGRSLIYVALDDKDVRDLSDGLSRAAKKAATLQKQFSRAGFEVLTRRN